MKKIKLYAFTERGRALADKVAEFDEMSVVISEDGNVSKEDFTRYDALVFIGAVGIAVRKIAPFVSDKLKDPAVVVMDEKAGFVIPILSGHVGGANELSIYLAERFGATSVVTTATDVNGIIAIDEFAKKNDLRIVNRNNIKKVSSGLLKGKPVSISFEDDVLISGRDSDIDEKVLGLIYSPIVAGIGMRKGIDPEKLDIFFVKALSENGFLPSDVSAIATIDIKKNEPALIYLSGKYDIPCRFYSKEELNGINGDFDESDFVRKAVGVGDVSARAAKALGQNGDFILKKKKEDGMTLSLFKKLRRITFEY